MCLVGERKLFFFVAKIYPFFSISTTSWVFAGRSVGFYVGAFMPYFLYNYLDPLLTLIRVHYRTLKAIHDIK